MKSTQLEFPLPKTLDKKPAAPHLDQQRKSLFCMGSTDMSQIYASGKLEHHGELMKGSF